MKSPAIQNWRPCFAIGSGSSALVYLAVSIPDGFPFALKCPSSPSSSPALLNELRLLLPLSSPFVLRCFGAAFNTPSDPQSPSHIFLEFMDGGSLSSLLKRSAGRLDDLLARHCTRSIAQGLEYLHSNGIVHCDIKSQNILIGSSGVKIADLGAAKRVGAEAVQPDHFRGTPLWMAPEVVQGVEQGLASDIWSLGCTLVEMLQGRPPWGHVSDMSAALFNIGVSEQDPPLPTAISDHARDFLSHCLQRDPRARWTASQLLQHPFLCDIPVGAALKHEQLSPRSTLNFFPTDESDSDDISDCSSLVFQSAAKIELSTGSSRSSIAKSIFADSIGDVNEHDWITVKMNCAREPRQMPFMKSGHRHCTRGRDVSLNAVEFLRRRRILG